MSVRQSRLSFGSRLRRLREQAGVTGSQLAREAGWAPSKVSRLEHGKQTPSRDDLITWTRIVAAPAGTAEELLHDLHSLRVEYAAWRRQLRTGHLPRQRAGQVLAQTTTRFRLLVAEAVPGFLQTAEYAHHVFSGLARLRQTPDDAADAVSARLRRQESLYDPAKHFDIVITEAALRYRPCPPSAHLGQLDRIRTLAALDSVSLAVLPFSTTVPFLVHTSFSLYDDNLVLVETFNAELSFRDSEDIALYARAFEQLSNVALHGAAAVDFIDALIHEQQRNG